ncbi:MAG: aminoacyl-tRNA hydrolase [Anaerolineaceae bacterium]|nr:aminoacyl-tRNA hydrolase [Anaerolineaceae bacterium]
MDGEIIAVDDRVQIPLSELEFRFSRSSGPGGQHVQKSSTRVELLFDVARSPSLDDEQRARVLSRLSGYVDSDGVLHVVSQSERSQWRNRQEVVERFQELMRRALARRKRRRATRPTAASREQRLEQKKRRGQIKRHRGPVEEDW